MLKIILFFIALTSCGPAGVKIPAHKIVPSDFIQKNLYNDDCYYPCARRA